jgi:hypothetical protein
METGTKDPWTRINPSDVAHGLGMSKILFAVAASAFPNF